MNNVHRLQRILLLLAGVLLIVPPAAFGALSDEISVLSSSVKGYVMNHETTINQEARRLAGTYDTEVIEFTNSHIGKVDRPIRCLLLRAVTQLPDKKTALNVLYNLALSKKGQVHRDIITAISYCDRDEVMNVALRLAKNTKSRQGGNSALGLIGVFGNSATVSLLEQLEMSTEDKQYKKAIASTRKKVRTRMNTSAAKAKDRDNYALPYWRIPRETPLIRSVVMRYFLQAELLNKRGYLFPKAFLKDRLQENDPLAAALIATQKESDCVEELKMFLSDESIMKEVCRRAIAHIEGTRPIDLTSFFASK